MSEDDESYKKLEGLIDLEYECCNDWMEHVSIIGGIMNLATMHSGFPEYEGLLFRYCPYCGESRMQQTE